MTITAYACRAGLALALVLLAACATPGQHIQPEINHHGNTGQARPHEGDSLRVMTLNIAHARGTGINQMLQTTHEAHANLNNIALLLKHEAPDVVSLQEVDRKSYWNGNFNHVSFLAENGAFRQSLSGAHVKGLGLDYGTALVAKLDLASPLSITFNPVDPAGPKGFVVSSFQWPGKQCIEVDVVSAHLDFASAQTRREQAAEIISTLRERDRPVILMGDFNSGWKRDNSALRKLADELDLHPFAPGAGNLVTFPKHQRRLDWILVSPEIDFQSYRVVETPVSDHLGVVSDLSISHSCG